MDSKKNHYYMEIVTKVNGSYRRLFWIRESGNPAGVRCGLIDRETNGGHMTYYNNGTTHIESKAGILSEYDYIIPDNMDDEYYIIGYSNVYPENSQLIEALDKKSQAADKIVEIDESLVGESIWVNLYLAKKDKAHNVLSGILTDNFSKKRGLIYKEVLELNHMPAHSLIILILNESH